MKVWIRIENRVENYQNRIENYYHHDEQQLGFYNDEEQLGFYKKLHIKRQSMSKKKDVLIFYIARSKWIFMVFIYLIKTIQENVQ